MDVRETKWCVSPFLAGGWWIDGIGNVKALGTIVDGFLELNFVSGGELKADVEEEEEAEEVVLEAEEPIISKQNREEQM